MPEDTHTPVSTAARFTVVKTWKQTKYPSTSECIKKIHTHIHTHTHTRTQRIITQAYKKKEFESVVARWMNLVSVTESKSEREKQILYINTYKWNLEKQD